MRAGREDEARRVLARQAAPTGTAYAEAMHARSRGLLVDDFPDRLAEALARDDRRPMPFERRAPS